MSRTATEAGPISTRSSFLTLGGIFYVLQITVDVADWGRSEVSGIAEGNMHRKRPGGGGGGRAVTSMRSSLFKKSAGAQGVKGVTAALAAASILTENGEEEEAAPPGELIFKNEDEAGDMDRTLQHIRNESLLMCSYGKDNKRQWAKDILALAHNGLRSELKDLSTMLQAFTFIRGNITTTEYGDLRKWWTVFSGLISDYVGLETTVLIPWVGACLKESGRDDDGAAKFLETAAGRLKTLKGAALAIGKLFCIICDELPLALRAKAPSKKKAASSIMLHTDRFISLLVDFMWEGETQLSGLLSDFYDEKLYREKILTGMVNHMTDDSSARTEEWLVLQTRWMSDAKLARAHMRVLNNIHRFSPVKLLSSFEKQHAGIVLIMKSKADM